MENLPLSNMEQKMLQEQVVAIRYTQVTPRTIFCILVCNDGYEFHGSSCCKDLDKFDEEAGKIFAMKHALSRMYRKRYTDIDRVS